MWGKWFRIEGDDFIVEARKTFRGTLTMLIRQGDTETLIKLDRATVDQLRKWIDRAYPDKGYRGNNVRQLQIVSNNRELPVSTDKRRTERDPGDPEG